MRFDPGPAEGQVEPEVSQSNRRKTVAGTTLNGTEICARLDSLAASGAAFDAVLSSAVDFLHNAHPDFHWTGVYELFPDNVLRLGPFIGAPTASISAIRLAAFASSASRTLIAGRISRAPSV